MLCSIQVRKQVPEAPRHLETLLRWATRRCLKLTAMLCPIRLLETLTRGIGQGLVEVVVILTPNGRSYAPMGQH